MPPKILKMNVLKVSYFLNIVPLELLDLSIGVFNCSIGE